jgi:hypothetical protein
MREIRSALWLPDVTQVTEAKGIVTAIVTAQCADSSGSYSGCDDGDDDFFQIRKKEKERQEGRKDLPDPSSLSSHRHSRCKWRKRHQRLRTAERSRRVNGRGDRCPVTDLGITG